jgi:RHS repeat-associated protein
MNFTPSFSTLNSSPMRNLLVSAVSRLVHLPLRMFSGHGRFVALATGLMLTLAQWGSAATVVNPEPAKVPGGGRTTCERSPGDSGSASSSIHWHANLGQSRWNRGTDNLGLFRVPAVEGSKGSMAGKVPRSFSAVSDQQYGGTLMGNRHQFEVFLSSANITAALATPAILEWYEGSDAQLIKSGAVLRQVLTDDCLTDIQPLAGGEGWRLRVWSREMITLSGSPVYDLPTENPMADITFSNPDHPADDGRLVIKTVQEFGASGTRTIVERFTQTSSPDRMVVETWQNAADAGSLLKKETLDYSDRGSKVWDYTLVRTVEEADLGADGTVGATLHLVGKTQEVYKDFSANGGSGLTGGQRLTSLTEGYGAGAPRTTTYTYYDMPSNPYKHGRLKSVERADGSWEYHEYSDSQGTPVATETIYRSWNDVTLADRANALKESYEIEPLKVTVIRSVGAIQIGKEEWVTETQGDGSLERTDRRWDGSAYHKEVSAYYPESGSATSAGRIKWRELPDGTAETWAYGGDLDALTVTHLRGAGSRAGVTDGLKTEEIINRTGYAYWHAETDVSSAGDVLLTRWVGSGFDNSRRPTRFDYYKDSTTSGASADYRIAQYACCGLEMERSRDGSVRTYSRDALKRVYSVVSESYAGDATPVTTATSHTGLFTETSRGGLLVSKTERHLNGETLNSWSPDADGDSTAELTSYAYALQANGTYQRTETDPKGGTVITNTYRDGRNKSVSGTAASAAYYIYATHALNGGGTTTQAIRGGSAGTEWTTGYVDQLGRTIRTTWPDGAVATVGYNGPSAAAGSAGKMAWSKDADEIAAAGTGSYIQYGYNAKGESSTVTEHLADSQTRTTVTATTAETSVTLNGQTFGPAHKTTTGVNSVTVSESWSAVDGRASGSKSFGQVSVSVSTLPSAGAWTVTGKGPDGQTSVQSYSDGRLEETQFFDNQNTPVLIASTSQAYDAIDRLLSTTDSRTGTTSYTMNGSGVIVAAGTAGAVAAYTAAGNLLGMRDPGGRITSFVYDALGRVTRTKLPDDSETHTTYTLRGEVEASWGSQTYPTFRTYDEQGRMKTLRTKPTIVSDVPTNSGGSLTTSNYSTTRGWLDNKRDDDGKGADYTYTAAGRLKTRTWARTGTDSNRVKTTYGYDQGMLETVNYANDPASTPNLVYTYDAFGRIDQVTRGGVPHADYGYDPDDLVLLTERLNIETIDRTLTRTYQDGTGDTVNLRPNGYSFGEGATVWTFDNAGRPSTISSPVVNSGESGTDTWTYGYRYDVAGSDHLGVFTGGTESLTLFSIDGPEIETLLEYDETRAALLSRTNGYDSGTLSKFAYTVNPLGQRDDVTPTGDAFSTTTKLSWTYNTRGELVTADRVSSTSFDRSYSYDGIGNRLTSSDQTAATTSYYSDAGTTPGATGLNQYARVTYPGSVSIGPDHDDDGNMKEGPVPGANGLNPGVALPTDADLTWDAENRLVEIVVGLVKVSYEYDYLGRRMLRDDQTTVTRYLYDGWNCIAEYTEETDEEEVTYTHQRSYVWGLDLSQSPQGAGGVGGLLSIVEAGATTRYYPAYDGNGNVSEYVNESGTEVAHFEYDPFGNLTETSYADDFNSLSFTYKFSTKPQDSVTGLYYYGYRYYDPVTGRWPSRDPIEEAGGMNLYGFVGNDGVNRIDRLGLFDLADTIWRFYRSRLFGGGLSNLPTTLILDDNWLYELEPDTRGDRLDAYQKHLFSQIAAGKVNFDKWETIVIDPVIDAVAEYGIVFAVPRKKPFSISNLPTDDIGFWLNRPGKFTFGGSYEACVSRAGNVTVKNISTHWTWHDRIDANPHRDEGITQWLIENFHAVFESLNSAPFDVEINFRENFHSGYTIP